MADKYLLKADWQSSWQEVTKEEWIKAERSAGFRPKLSSDHADYMKTCATSGFSGNGVSGKIGVAGYITGDLVADLWWFIENVTDEEPSRQEQFFALRERVRENTGNTPSYDTLFKFVDSISRLYLHGEIREEPDYEYMKGNHENLEELIVEARKLTENPGETHYLYDSVY